MDTLYIGAKYEIGNIQYDDGSAFSATPCVVLYNPSSRHYYEADVTDLGDNIYNAVISAATSATFVPGTYSLEIYADSTREDILYHEKESVNAIHAASSLNSSSGSSSN